MITTSHAIVLPYPAQGHVIPMLELSRWLVGHSVKVTFVNTHFNHRRVVEAAGSLPEIGGAVTMVSVADGLEDWEDRNDLGKLTEVMMKVVPVEVEALITRLNRNDGPKITCIIVDWTIAWAADYAAERLGLRTVAFCPAAATTFALCYTIPKLLADGIVDENGRPLKDQMIEMSPAINSGDLLWIRMGDEFTNTTFFHMLSKSNHTINSSDWILCNSSHDLEPGVFSSFPRFKPIGPLLAATRLPRSTGSFWPEDSTCLTWLHQHPPNSVIYAAFGSFTVLDTTQFRELALGLELAGRPFLWVVRPDMVSAGEGLFPAGFEGRRGKVVGWAPQKEVLAHPSVACFISHCGWNSTVEGVSSGVPFLCWPYFAEQFVNRDYICDEWKVGLRLEKDENGIVTREEVKEKVESLVGDGGFKERILNLQERVMDGVKGGSSRANFNNFVDWMKNL